MVSRMMKDDDHWGPMWDDRSWPLEEVKRALSQAKPPANFLVFECFVHYTFQTKIQCKACRMSEGYLRWPTGMRGCDVVEGMCWWLFIHCTVKPQHVSTYGQSNKAREARAPHHRIGDRIIGSVLGVFEEGLCRGECPDWVGIWRGLGVVVKLGLKIRLWFTS